MMPDSNDIVNTQNLLIGLSFWPITVLFMPSVLAAKPQAMKIITDVDTVEAEAPITL